MQTWTSWKRFFSYWQETLKHKYMYIIKMLNLETLTIWKIITFRIFLNGTRKKKTWRFYPRVFKLNLRCHYALLLTFDLFWFNFCWLWNVFPAIWGQRLCFNLEDSYIDFAPGDFEPWRRGGVCPFFAFARTVRFKHPKSRISEHYPCGVKKTCFSSVSVSFIL